MNFNDTEDKVFELNINVVNNLNEITENSNSNNGFFCGIEFDTITKYLHHESFEILKFFSLYVYESFIPKDSIFYDFSSIQALIDNAIYKSLTNSTNSKNIHMYSKKNGFNKIFQNINESIIVRFIYSFYSSFFFHHQF